jgi:hypothetical protein
MGTESDRRDFPRLKQSVPVRYKFMSSSVKDEAMEQVCDGMTNALSMGGLLLVGRIPVMDWTKDLLLGKITIGINLYLPGTTTPVKFPTRCLWIEAAEQGSINMKIGLRILDMGPEQRRMVSEFLTRASA